MLVAYRCTNSHNATAKLAVRLYITGLYHIRSIKVFIRKTHFTTPLSIMQYAILQTDKMIENFEFSRESLFGKSFLVCSITASSFVFEKKTM